MDKVEVIPHCLLMHNFLAFYFWEKLVPFFYYLQFQYKVGATPEYLGNMENIFFLEKSGMNKIPVEKRKLKIIVKCLQK